MTLSSTHSYVESFPIVRDGTFFSFNITPLSGCQGAEGKFSTLLVALLATKGGRGEIYASYLLLQCQPLVGHDRFLVCWLGFSPRG